LVRSTLLDLKLAIEGTIIMSENLRDALDCMYDARIPAKWLKVSLLLGNGENLWFSLKIFTGYYVQDFYKCNPEYIQFKIFHSFKQNECSCYQTLN